MDNTVIGNFPNDPRSPLYDGFMTTPVPFNPGIKPDAVHIVGGGAGSVTFAAGKISIVDRFGALASYNFRRVLEDTVIPMAYKAAAARVQTFTLLPASAYGTAVNQNFYGNMVELVIREFNPGEVNQSADEKPYRYNPAPGDSDLTILTNLASNINRDPYSRMGATIDNTTPSAPKLVMTERTPGRWGEAVNGRRLSKATEVTANQKQVLDGPYLAAIQAGVPIAAMAAGLQYRGLAFMYEDPHTFAGSGDFVGGTSHNNSKVLMNRTVWVIGQVADSDATTKINIVGTILSGAYTPATAYNSRTVYTALT